MMAAVAAAETGHEVVLLEKNEKLGKKIYITGKGRCNLTNACDRDAFFRNIVSNPKFLYSAYYHMDQEAVMNLMEEEGCPVKTERGDRVFRFPIMPLTSSERCITVWTEWGCLFPSILP